MIAFISLSLAKANLILIVGSILAYAASIIVTMAVVGASSGLLFRLTEKKGERFHASAQIISAVLVFVFAVVLLLNVLPDVLT